ncbi:hypothetical protein [Burkholderia sp. Nafp2/4-1b]|uniref:hypothetical protein n=1 Tax=Burkholderia sp. Nafp2/4-1b TaxID=2116686 RepID=UPI0013CE4DC9|nr:hypothetical protein [Burkholderia sp. Nafp2/4-1b]
MDLHAFKNEMMVGAQQVEREAPVELDSELLALVGGGASSQANSRGWFANATWSKAWR